MTRTKLILGAALAACVWLTACGPTWYRIILTPNGAVMERKITQRFGPEEFERLALLYGQDIDAGTLEKFEEADVHETSLTGTFGADMPPDSHNRGVYLYCDSPLGSAAIYTERFGGRYDLAAMLRQQDKAFNVFWDVLLLHLDALVGDSADYAALRSFLDSTMRADMSDLMLELTVSDFGEDATRNLSILDDFPDDALEKFMRVLHFLDARGYITLRETLEITVGEFDEDEWFLVVVKTLGESVGRRMGMETGAMPAAFEVLMDFPQSQLEDELERLQAADERIVRRLADYRKEFDGMSAAEPSDSMELLFEQVFLFDFDLLDLGGNARDVTLYIPVEPYMTNGMWYDASEIETDDKRSYVEWQFPLANIAPAGDLAQVVFAFWAEPNEDYQVERFGASVLEEDSLAEQCRWRQMLGPSLREEWDAFVDQLVPGADLENRLKRFRFGIEDPPARDGNPQMPDSVIARGVVLSITSKLQHLQPQN